MFMTFLRSYKRREIERPVLSETDRLSATIQTDQEESEIFIRSQEVRDRTRPVAVHTTIDIIAWPSVLCIQNTYGPSS